MGEKKKKGLNQSQFATLTAEITKDWENKSHKQSRLTACELAIVYAERIGVEEISISTIVRAFQHCAVGITPDSKRHITVHEMKQMRKTFLGLCKTYNETDKDIELLAGRIGDLEAAIQTLESHVLPADHN